MQDEAFKNLWPWYKNRNVMKKLSYPHTFYYKKIYDAMLHDDDVSTFSCNVVHLIISKGRDFSESVFLFIVTLIQLTKSFTSQLSLTHWQCIFFFVKLYFFVSTVDMRINARQESVRKQDNRKFSK